MPAKHVLFIVMACSLLASAAQAASRRWSPPDYDYYRDPPVQACVKSCPNDFAPCDPQYMKHADGRCTGVMPGMR
jgi:hypothetical protein